MASVASLVALAAGAAAVVPGFRDEPRPPGQAGILATPPETLADWGLDDAADVRAGQLRQVLEADGDRLSVSLLRDRPPPGPPELEARRRPPPLDGDCFEIAAFDEQVNRLGGRFDAFERAPSSASAERGTAPDGRSALEVGYDRAASGFAGVGIELHADNELEGTIDYLDSSGLDVLTFWVRGAVGGERLRLKVADRRWDRREDAVAIGELGAFLDGPGADGVTAVAPEWRRVVVPLEGLPGGVDRRELARLVVEPAAPGAGRFWITGLAVCRAAAELPPLPPPAPDGGDPSVLEPPPLAVWVWNTGEILAQAGAAERLASFLVEHGFTDAYLQLPGVFTRATDVEAIATEAPGLWDLVGTLGERGIVVHALDGAAELALPEHHDLVLRTVDNVARFNAAAQPQQRFAGIHYDIEPYLLDAFRGVRYEPVLRGYLRVLELVRERAGRHGLVFGVAIPFWFDSMTLERDRQPGPGRPSIGQQVLDRVDVAVIMDYRTRAGGSDGTVAHASAELHDAAGRGVDVWVALETGALDDEWQHPFEGEPGRGVPASPPAPWTVFAVSGDPRPAFYLVAAEALDEFGSLWPEGAADGLVHWPVQRSIFVPAEKITFHGKGADRLQEVMRQTLRELHRRPAFAGFALHHYRSLQEMLSGRSRPLLPLSGPGERSVPEPGGRPATVPQGAKIPQGADGAIRADPLRARSRGSGAAPAAPRGKGRGCAARSGCRDRPG